MMLDRTKLPFLQAKEYGSRRGMTPGIIVLHTAENGNDPTGARGVAEYFTTITRPASSHYVVDKNEIIHCVQESDAAWGAPGANEDGLHIEHAGTAAWTAADWARDDVLQMLDLSAQLTASLCASYGIDAVWLSPADITAGKAGITGHVDVTKAFPLLHGTHTDPGPAFPIAKYISMVSALMP